MAYEGRFCTVTVTSSGPYVKGKTPFSVSVTGKSGWTITRTELDVGWVIGTGTTSASATPSRAGTLEPTVRVFAKGSGGQETQALTLDPIDVIAPYVSTTVTGTRVNASGIASDDGTNACLKVNIDYIKASGNYLTKPTVKINGTATNNVTWYTTWTADGGFSNAVSWTNYAPNSPVTLYGKVTDTLTDSLNYSISVKVASTFAESTEVSIKIAQVFRLLSARPGGKGLGIGMKPTSDALWVNMDTEVTEMKDVHYALNPEQNPENPDYDLYTMLTSLGVNPKLKEMLTFLTNAVKTDYIVEEGTSGIWTYRKWNSGIAECWGYATATNISMTTHYGSLYYGALRTQTFPTGLFASAPNLVQVQAYDNGNGTYASMQTWTKDNVTYYPYTTASATYKTGFIFNVKGRWK